METIRYRYPAACQAIVDVTKPPYNVDNTGRIDCTAQLRQAVNDVMGAYEKNFYETRKKLQAQSDPNALISFEIRKVDGRENVIFPEELPPSRILYFPNGEYLVSDTISYDMEEFRNFLMSLRHLEMNGQLRFMGESRDGVTIRLKDNCPGFEFGSERPVISFMRGEASNIAQTNMFENFTIDIGKGNPGAIGLVYFGNNTGAIRNVRIRSSDPEHRGHTGLAVIHDKVSACLVQNLEVDGFSYGVRITPQTHFVTIEHIRLTNQRRWGIYVGDTIVTIRDLVSHNTVPAIRINGATAFVSLVDAELTGGNPLDAAVHYDFGQCYLRNIRSEGYEYAMSVPFAYTRVEFRDRIDEYCSHGPKTLFEGTDPHGLNLPVEEAPTVPWDAPEDWVSVQEFGAAGDGTTDDTAAIQRAMDSGKPTIYFQPGRYLVDGPIRIPASVRRVQFFFSDFAVGPHLSASSGVGLFTIEEESDSSLWLEDLFVWEKFYGFMALIHHACRRTLVVSDVHVQTAAMYFNTVPGGKVFFENAGCTIGGVPGAGIRKQPLPGEEKFPYSRQTPCFDFRGQQVWCRQVNPERSLHEMVNDGGTLWVMGFKTEEEGTAFTVRGGGSTEVLGGTFCIGLDKPYPILLNDHSCMSVFASTYLYHLEQRFPLAVREIQEEGTREFHAEDMPVRCGHSYTIPLYVGRSSHSISKGE